MIIINCKILCFNTSIEHPDCDFLGRMADTTAILFRYTWDTHLLYMAHWAFNKSSENLSAGGDGMVSDLFLISVIRY